MANCLTTYICPGYFYNCDGLFGLCSVAFDAMGMVLKIGYHSDHQFVTIMHQLSQSILNSEVGHVFCLLVCKYKLTYRHE